MTSVQDDRALYLYELLLSRVDRVVSGCEINGRLGAIGDYKTALGNSLSPSRGQSWLP